MSVQKTFIMIKPDGVQRGLIGEVVRRFESKGLQLVGAKLMNVSKELAEKHYAEHQEKPFFGELVSFITSGPVFATVWQGDDVIALARLMMGKTKPIDSAPGTIRGDFAASITNNIIHGSDSEESAQREISLWFGEEAVVSYEKTINRWV